MFYGLSPAFLVDLATRDATESVEEICRRFGFDYSALRSNDWFNRIAEGAFNDEDVEQIDRAKFRLIVTDRLLPALAVQAEDLRVPYKDRVALLEFASEIGGLAKPPQLNQNASGPGFSVTINFATPSSTPTQTIDITPTQELIGSPPAFTPTDMRIYDALQV